MLVDAVMDKKTIRKAVRKTHIERRKISLLKEEKVKSTILRKIT